MTIRFIPERNRPSQARSSLPRLVAGPTGQQVPKIYQDRLAQFTAFGQYENQNLCSRLYNAVVDDKDHVKLSVWSAPDLSRPAFKDAISHEFKPTRVGDCFGPSWSTHWIKIQLTVPKDLLREERLEFHWDSNNEGLIWTEDGVPRQGLSGGGERVEWVLPEAFRDGREHTFYVEMACNGMFGNNTDPDGGPPDPNRTFQLESAKMMVVNLEARALWVDFDIIGDAAREFPADSWESHEAQQVGNAIMDTFYIGNGSQESILKCRELAAKYLGPLVDSHKVYESNAKSIVFATGHCHIDSCWLWPFVETKRKVARSWANQCDLIDRYPEYRFTCSQAQQYKWLKEEYPALFERVKAKVKQGSFQFIGGSWVEHDTNMPSSESLVRQFLYGQRFYEGNFGERCQTFWLPDTFGYSSQLPQLCRLAGMTSFFTQKLSWNNINNFPHTTFKWVALDGSQVICHMPPSETYNSQAHFGEIRRSVTQHKSLDQDNTSLLVFGKGDGGGGPTWEHLEKLRRCRGLSDQTGLLPRVSIAQSVNDFFAALHKRAEEGTEFVTWYGELYFEFHRGTYTTQANNKRNNRKAEILLHNLEYLATMASLKDRLAGTRSSDHYAYPKKELDDMWEKVLRCQFHDCLPGSSIHMCYDESDKFYEEVFSTGTKLLKQALAALGYPGRGSKLATLNCLPWQRKEVVRIPEALQAGSNSPYALVTAEPGFSIIAASAFSTAVNGVSVREIKRGVFEVQNSHYRIVVEQGALISLYDLHAKREIVAEGKKANQLVLFDDKPLSYQAWDVEMFHLTSRRELHSGTTRIEEQGPHRVSLVTETKISDQSWAKTTISLSAAADDNEPGYVEMEMEVEWHETTKFLKVEFPVRVRNTEASYETQFGITRRPTHYNTSWDMAKFEVCCHKFADLSEAGYGVSILNDSKYGFATAGSLMRLSLLRSPKIPDDLADMGHHRIRYAIFPHSGCLDHRTVRAGYNFNNPLSIHASGPESLAADSLSARLPRSIQLTGSEQLVLDTIKRGEDDEDVHCGELKQRPGQSVIVRVFESLGGLSRGMIVTSLPVKQVFKTNILEDDEEELEIQKISASEARVDVELRGFEVATFRLQL